MPRPKTEEKRKLILETAKRLFALQGVGVSMNEMAEAIGIPVGSIYTYFDSKQVLVETIIEEGWNEYRLWLEDGISAIQLASQNADARLTALKILSFFVNKALPKLFSDVELIMLLLAEAGATARLEEKLQYFSSMITKLVSECQIPGAAENDPRQYNTGITVLLLGALEALRLSSKTDLKLGADDIQAFFRLIVENALGQRLPDMD
jgi:AcrR family transcriptional regulator